ncbi:MAG: hypothetical protein HGA80_04895, partial [Candidatus Omnitrophica bacterium]|nr:hypothetical protein [Candidatus Omnitrophota bacterium]
KVFGTIQNSFWIQFGVANVFLFFGLAMLEAIHLPGWNLARDNHKKEGWLGVFLMGFASGFVVGPCTAPVLGALLVHVAARQNITFGVSLLMTFAFGLGFLLVVAGTFSGLLASLPRSGAWMRWVKRLAGLGLLGLAEYYFLRAGQLM